MNPYRWIILVFGMLAYQLLRARSNYTGIARFVSADLGLDKASLGVMGAAFSAYAAGRAVGRGRRPLGQPTSRRHQDLSDRGDHLGLLDEPPTAS